MFVYSKKIIRFANEIKASIKTILSREIGLQVSGERFYDRRLTASYPIRVVIYNDKTIAGYFDAEFCELGFHECLMHLNSTQLHQIIRHELAHYITFINYGNTIQPHGPEFKAFCLRMNWGEEVYKASLCLDDLSDIAITEKSPIFRKIQKLMALTTSSNPHEAELAMIKSQQLLVKHHIDPKYIDSEESEKITLKRIMKQKKITGKMRAIARILETFFVSIVYARNGSFTYLEIFGTSVNTEIAEYVATVLDSELDKLWRDTQKSVGLKGMTAKNSFFTGIAKGYCNKVQALKKNYSGDTIQTLMIIEKQLVNAQAMIYQNLSSTKSRSNHCEKSAAIGEQMGAELNIHAAIDRPSNRAESLIAYSG